ncbi:Hypercellular protein HypA [Rasamsonia emersonii CBS 393.64]|uniref:Hypercellular protein HypA n=1 Tax=Rasamsonia emersonii (strain ATCC 16479 / CBS 393.64 / IMI 116815) TaxID=1408163 RepID=A0A0F4YLJ3_RASE3|nr:Hypercellular protein HypA [Rasamsonia emersonii CBS 393.64]KKA18716.1 Hypercellular protein HypA [Rasamsonia emersonii CBS 393.64]
MGVDPLSPVAPARLNVLLLPVGRIKRSRFLSFAARIQAENVVRLGDVSPDPRPNRNMFTPLAFPNGMILYDLSFSVPPISHLELFPFEIFREPLVVLAIADGAELQDNTKERPGKNQSSPKKDAGVNTPPSPEGLKDLLQELSSVKEQNPKALVCQLLVFEYDGLDKLLSGPEDVIWVPSPQASRPTTMKTVLCDITSLLLGELDQFAKLMQSIPAIESPRASSWGPRRGPELRPRLFDKLMHRMTMPAQLPSAPNGGSESAGSSGRSSPAPGGHESPTTFDEITRSIQLANRSNSTGKQPSSKETSRDRMSVQGMSAADRTKNRIKGRLGVVIGTLYLQSGRWPDALKELVEAASMARAGSDYVWHGKALESILLCLLMLGWAGMDFQIPQVCYPVADKSGSKSSYTSGDTTSSAQTTPGNRVVSLQNLANLLPDLCNNIINLYNRAAAITDEPLPPLVFSETVIRLSRLLTAIRIRDGNLDDNALEHIVMNEPLIPLHQPERPRGAPLLRKSEIANFLFRALPPSPSSDMPATDAEKAFVLKELLSIMIPSLVEARKIGAAEVGIHPAAGLSSLSDTSFDINALDIGHGNMEASIRALLSMIGETYGVQPSAYHEHKRNRPVSAISDSDYDSVAAIVERSFRHVTLNGYGDLNLKIDILKASINLCEALPDFEGVLQYTVELLQTIRGDLMLPETSRIPPLLPPDEQIRLLNNIKRTVGAAHKLGAVGLEAEYWDDFLVRGVELMEFPESKRPFRRSKKDLSTVPVDKSKQEPFLYSPFSKLNGKASESLLIAKESATFKVILQNPYEFDLEIESLRLDSEGGVLEAEVFGVWVPPFSLQEVLVPGVAHTEGTLTITGCIVKVRHCRRRKFPIFAKLWKPEPEKKLKRTGLAAKKPLTERPLSWSSTTSKDGKVVAKLGPETATCSLKVINPQPTVIVQSTSLSQSAVMVLEGETRSFDVTLQNTSSCPVDFVLFTFQDSTTRQLQSALSNKDLLPPEIYELELQLSTKPSLRWRRQGTNPEDVMIAPGQKATFTVEVFGKPGLQDAVVQIDYCHLGTPRDDIPETFYTRQLSLPIMVTVNASVEVTRCDIVPLTGDFAWFNQNHQKSHSSSDDEKSTSLSSLESGIAQFTSMLPRLGVEPYGSDHCLMILDLRNAWPNPLSVTLHVSEHPRADTDSSDEASDGSSTVTGDLQPGQISRFILVLPRIFLDNPHAAIPFLNTGFRRQFVVSATKLSFEAEAASREAFWYREELLKRVFGVWKEEATGREGRVDFRSIRLNPRMVDAMRLEDVEVTFSLSPLHGKDGAVTQTRRSKYVVKTNDFLTLSVKIHNRSSRPIHPLLRLQPGLCNQPSTIALDLSRRLAWTGMLQRVLPVLEGGQTTEVTLGVTVLCRGEYEIGASVEEVRIIKPPSHGKENTTPEGSQSKHGHKVSAQVVHDGNTPPADTFGVDVMKTRRVWHAREYCIIFARD